VTEADGDARRRAEADPALGLSEALVRTVGQALEAGEAERAADLAAALHAADQADLLEQLGHEERASLVAELRPKLDPELLTHLDETLREEVLGQLSPEETGAALARLDTDDAIDVLEDLDAAEQIAILETLPMPERAAVEQGLTYPEDSAGRLMQRALVAAPEFWTVGQTIDYLRARPDLPDDFYDIYIVNPRFEPVGSIPLSKVLRSRRGVLLAELKLKELHLIPFDMDQEEVAFLFRQYGLVSAPVVDANRRLLGVVTVDDVVHVLEEEAEEDILWLGGVPEADLFVSPLRTSMRRVPWLLLNLGTATLAALVIAQFADAIDALVVLAILMPIVAALGGNAAIQALSVTVRALAMRQVTRANAWRVLGKELLVGGLNGAVVLLAGLALVIGWFGQLDLALVFGAGIVLTITIAALAGAAVPIVLDRIGLDPAVASSVFVTTITDMFAFFVFLGLAAVYLL
jgi:magnesium transporter